MTHGSRRSPVSTPLKSAILVLLVWMIWVPRVLASGTTNEVIVEFGPGTVEFGNPQATLPIGQISTDTSLVTQLLGIGAISARRVFPNYSLADTMRILASGDTVWLPDLTQTVVLTLSAAGVSAGTLSDLEQLASVQYAESNIGLLVDRVPTDPGYGDQSYLKGSGGQIGLRVASAWDDTTGSASLRVGIIDTGIRYTHEEFGNGIGPSKKVAAAYNFVTRAEEPHVSVDNFHGSNVAGMIGALTNNTKAGLPIGIAGIAGGWGYNADTGTGHFGAQLVSLNVYDDVRNTNALDAVAAALIEGSDPLRFNCKILNMSLGERASELSPLGTRTLNRAIHLAGQFGAVLVASKGNQATGEAHYPADLVPELILGVGSLDAQGFRWIGNYGNNIDCAALGDLGDAPYVDGGNDSDYSQGLFYATSAAAPQVSGLAALLLSETPGLHQADVQGIISHSTDDLGPDGWDEDTGYGSVNAARAMAMLRAPWSLQRLESLGGTVAASSSPYWQYIEGVGDRYVVRYDVRKVVQLPSGFQATPNVWGRGVSASLGWFPTEFGQRNQRTGYCSVVNSNATTAELQTFVYRGVNGNGLTDVYYPTDAAHARFAYTVLGEYPELTAEIAGPASLNYLQWGEWTASVEGGDGSREYQWRWRNAGGGAWSAIVDQDAVCSRQMLNASIELQLTVLSAGMTVVLQHGVQFSGDTSPPTTVTNLNASNSGSSTIALSWTHPAEDATGSAQCAGYELRYSNVQITSGSFASATAVGSQPGAGVAGTAASYVFSGRDPCSPYYFALKARDEVGNWSAMSNLGFAPPSSSGSECSGGGGGEDPPILQHSGRRGEEQAAYRISDGPMSFSVLLGPGQSPARLEIFDVRGRLLKTILGGEESPGWHKFSWRLDDDAGSPLAPGVVFTSLRVPGIRRVGKLTILP